MGEATPQRHDQRPVGGAGAWIGLAVVWVVGCAPAAWRIVGNGENGFRGAVVIVVLGAVGLLLLHLPLLRVVDRLISLAALAGLGYWITHLMIGRVPLLFALASLVVADLAAFGRPSGTGRANASGPAFVGLATVGVAGAAWYAERSNAVALAILAAAVVATALHALAPVATVDRWVGALLARIPAPPSPRPAARRALDRAEVVGRRSAHAAGEWLAGAARRAGAALLVGLRQVWAWVGRGVARALAKRNRPILWSSLVVAILTAPTFHRLIAPPFERYNGTNDIPGTIDRVHWMRWWPPRIPVPHPGWTVAVKLTTPFLGDVRSVTLILAVATGAATAVLITIARSMWDDRPPLAWPLACALGIGFVVMENPAVLVPRTSGIWGRYLESGTHARGGGFFPLHMWATPTITMSMPFVFALIALVLLVMREVEVDSPRLARHRWALLGLTVASTMVQPATTLAFVPAVPVYLLISRRLSRPMARELGLCFVLPGTAVVLGQVWFLSSDVSPWERATWLWRPFWSFSYFGLDRPVFWATFLIFPLALWAGGRRYLRDPAVALSIVAMVVSAGPFLMLEQTSTYDVHDGDLGVPLGMAFIVSFVSTLRFMLLEAQELWRRRSTGTVAPPWVAATLLLVAAMVSAGLVDLAVGAGLTGER
jgi:hypothetical protein